VDLRKRLNQASQREQELWARKSRILVIETGGEAGGRLIGVIVDEVAEVLKLAGDRVEQAAPLVAGLSNQYITGVGKLDDKLLILIDIEKILSANQLATLDELATAA
jgi:purine-binding chemotaxis protein CheW